MSSPQLQEALERLINIEEKINGIMSEGVKLRAFESNTFTGHPDQAFGHLSYAQHGEDMIIVNIFHILGVDKPTYLDLGAHHPINISNTALLYKRGSRGINVEANMNLMGAFHQMRPDDINLNVGVGPESGELDFYMIDEFSGRNTFNRAAAEDFVLHHPEFKIRDIIKVPVLTVNEIIDKYSGGVFPDFMTIDIEGMDLPILDSTNFTETKPMVLCVEVVSGDDTDETARMVELLKARGFVPHARTVGNLILLSNEAHQRLAHACGM